MQHRSETMPIKAPSSLGSSENRSATQSRLLHGACQGRRSQPLCRDRERLRVQSQLEGGEGAQRAALARLAQLLLFTPLRR